MVKSKTKVITPEDVLTIVKEDIEQALAKTTTPTEELEPAIYELEWGPYVMSKFDPSELVEGKFPRVAAIKRVAQLLLGPVISSCTKVIQGPSLANGNYAVCEHTVAFLWAKSYRPGVEMPAYEATFTDAADAYEGNIRNPEMAKYLTCIAATRAEGRAYRKALNLSVCAAEELANPGATLGQDPDDAPIDLNQISLIDMICQRVDIDAWAYLNSGPITYSSINKVFKSEAPSFIKGLQTYQAKPSTVPNELRGYKVGWAK